MSTFNYSFTHSRAREGLQSVEPSSGARQGASQQEDKNQEFPLPPTPRCGRWLLSRPISTCGISLGRQGRRAFLRGAGVCTSLEDSACLEAPASRWFTLGLWAPCCEVQAGLSRWSPWSPDGVLPVGKDSMGRGGSPRDF